MIRDMGKALVMVEVSIGIRISIRFARDHYPAAVIRIAHHRGVGGVAGVAQERAATVPLRPEVGLQCW